MISLYGGMKDMATINKVLKGLTTKEIEKISKEYLHGWHDTSKYGFRIKGFNHERELRGLKPLTKDESTEYRIQYIQENFTYDVIKSTIEEYMLENRMSEARWDGIEILDCRFGRDYPKIFKRLLGNHEYRKLAEKCRVDKLTQTQNELYGGVGLASKSAKAKAQITSSKSKKEFLKNAVKSLKEHGCILETFRNSSVFEVFAYMLLLEHFDEDDIIIDYGVHPYDNRYPYPCDFHIKSIDLFIELNIHFTHGGHWYDENNSVDSLRKKHLEQTDRARNRKFLNTWCNQDVLKRRYATKNHLNYLVFWDSGTYHKGNTLVPKLTDLRMWLNDYNADVNKFINDHPENTY